MDLKKTLIIVTLFLGNVLLTACNRDRVNDNDLVCLKEKYSLEAINYFYETAYYRLWGGRVDDIIKWDKDIKIHLRGDMWPNDSLYVVNSINELNSLDLPVKLRITSNLSEANVPIVFGYIDSFSNTDAGSNALSGVFSLNDKNNGAMCIANNVGIYKWANKADCEAYRQRVILHEMTQLLGLTGDVWLYRNSILSHGKKRYTTLNEIDKQALKLLYEPSITTKYSRMQFEQDFADVLYHIEAPQKIARYMHEYNIPVKYLEFIRDNGVFEASTLVKYPQYAFIEVKQCSMAEDTVFLRKAANLINTVSDNIRLEIDDHDIGREFPILTFTFTDDPSKTDPIVDAELETGYLQFMFRRRLESTILQTYNKNKLVNNPEEIKSKNNIVFRTLLCALGLNTNDFNVIDIDSLGNLSFKPDYKEILALLYEPIFYSGISAKEIDEAIELMKQ